MLYTKLLPNSNLIWKCAVDFGEFCRSYFIPTSAIIPLLPQIFSFAVVQQFYQSRVIDEFVLKGNTGILKCLVPSFVTDFVQVEAWIADDGTTYKYQTEGDDFGNFSKVISDIHPVPSNYLLIENSRFPNFLLDLVKKFRKHLIRFINQIHGQLRLFFFFLERKLDKCPKNVPIIPL